MQPIKQSELDNYINKNIRLEYKVAEETTGAVAVATWVTSTFKLIVHDPKNRTITFEDSAGARFTWPYSAFRSIRTT